MSWPTGGTSSPRPRSARSRASPAARPASRPTTSPSALRAWHEAGAASGDLAFWRERAEQFRSAKAYALVVDALLEQRSPVASMALLVQWLSQADQIPLAEEDYSFHNLALDWMQDLWDDFDDGEAESRPDAAAALGPGPQVPRLPGGQRRGVLGSSAVRAGG